MHTGMDESFKYETANNTNENTQRFLNFDETVKLVTKVENELTQSCISEKDEAALTNKVIIKLGQSRRQSKGQESDESIHNSPGFERIATRQNSV
jgi:hypothetical protein